MTTRITTNEQVRELYTPSSEDWESIPSGLGSRLLVHLLTKSDVYGRAKVELSENDIISISSSGAFGGALAFLIGKDIGAREYRKHWSASRDAAAITLSLIARGVSGGRFRNRDIAATVVRDTEIARAIMACEGCERYGNGSSFRVLETEDFKIMAAEDIGAVAAVCVADSYTVQKALGSLDAVLMKSFITEFTSLYRERRFSPVDVITILSTYISPCSDDGMHLVSELVPSIGERWSPKADRTLRTHAILDRDAVEWKQGNYGDRGWLRMALNHCTEKSPDTLVSWIGQAPCLYEFLNTAAKQRRGVIAARELIKMVGR